MRPTERQVNGRLAHVFDSHCHLDFAAFDGDRAEVWEAAGRAGVRGLLVPAYAPAGWDALAALAASLHGVQLAVGVHPWALAGLGERQRVRALDSLQARAAELGAVAIGECGLDGLQARDGGAPWAVQEWALTVQLEVAEVLKLPVVLHVVKAHGRALALLQGRGGLPYGGVLHSYSGSAELVPRYAALNLSFSFSPSLARPGARRPAQAARAVARERLLIESDAPDQAPPGEPARGEPARGEPGQLGEVCRALAAARGETCADVADYTERNARTLFRCLGASRAARCVRTPKSAPAPGSARRRR